MKKAPFALLLYTGALCFLMILGCKKSDITDGINLKNEQIAERFKGKYAIVSAISDKEVDVNLDGTRSTDMLKEIPNLNNSYLELRPSSNLKNNLFTQFWQNQGFPYGSKPTAYDPEFYFTYANQATGAMFTFNDQLTRLNLFRTDNTSQEDFPLPKLVEVISGDRIRIPTEKTLYTKAGMVAVTIDVVYKRFTTTL